MGFGEVNLALQREKLHMPKKKHRWISGAIKHKGVFRSAAQKAGKSTREYAQEHKHDSGKLGSRARLALTLMGMHK
jgi:hypothetical protein